MADQRWGAHLVKQEDGSCRDPVGQHGQSVMCACECTAQLASPHFAQMKPHARTDNICMQARACHVWMRSRSAGPDLPAYRSQSMWT